MKRFKRLIAGLLYLAVFLVLLAGSCVGPGVMYIESPGWFLKKVDQGYTGSFFVAYRSKSDEAPQEIKVMRYEFDSDKGKYSDVQFHLPNGYLRGFGPWQGSSTITATAEEKGGQLVQVFVIGDTPWSALSEYRVVDNKIYPLRYADSAAWLLIGVVVCPILILALVRKPLRRGINRLMRIDPE
jgi:hypothetical protein